jgi:GNAT superfamily N-acetyltransferase
MALVFTIVRASVERAAEIAALYVTTRRAAYAAFFPVDVLDAMSIPAETLRWQARMAESDAETIVAVDEAQAIAGFTHISWHNVEEPATGEVEYMYVGTGQQGGGLGARLMAAAEAEMAASGMREAILWVYEGNARARGFYERCGWHPDGASKPSDSADGLFLVRYRKRLNRDAATTG